MHDSLVRCVECKTQGQLKTYIPILMVIGLKLAGVSSRGGLFLTQHAII